MPQGIVQSENTAVQLACRRQ